METLRDCRGRTVTFVGIMFVVLWTSIISFGRLQLTGSQADKTVFKMLRVVNLHLCSQNFLLERNDAINVWGNNTSPGHSPLREDNLIVKVFVGLQS